MLRYTIFKFLWKLLSTSSLNFTEHNMTSPKFHTYYRNIISMTIKHIAYATNVTRSIAEVVSSQRKALILTYQLYVQMQKTYYHL